MSATLAPTIWDLAGEKFNNRAKRRRVPEDPEWLFPKCAAVFTMMDSSFSVLNNLPFFLAQPDPVSVVSIAFSAKAAVDATINCVKTFKAARRSALHIADPSEPWPTLTPAESTRKSLSVSAYALASAVPNALNAGDGGWAAIYTGLALTCYNFSRKGPRRPGE